MNCVVVWCPTSIQYKVACNSVTLKQCCTSLIRVPTTKSVTSLCWILWQCEIWVNCYSQECGTCKIFFYIVCINCITTLNSTNGISTSFSNCYRCNLYLFAALCCNCSCVCTCEVCVRRELVINGVVFVVGTFVKVFTYSTKDKLIRRQRTCYICVTIHLSVNYNTKFVNRAGYWISRYRIQVLSSS